MSTAVVDAPPPALSPAAPRRWQRVALLLLVFAGLLLPGVFGRDPWKADEAYSFGLVLSIVEGGDWVVPTLAGEPFMEKPPLMYVVGAWCAQAFSPWLTLADGARVSVLLFNVLTLVFVGLASRELSGPGKGWLAALILAGCVGPIHSAHMLITDFAMLTGFAVAFYGFALAVRRPWLGGAAVGTGLGVAFMSKGLLGPGIIGLLALVLPVFCRPWRVRRYWVTLAAMGLAALPWLLIWPLLLQAKAPAQFAAWFWENNIGRFLGSTPGVPKRSWLFYFECLPWFAFPALPLAGWSWWRGRGAFGQSRVCQLSLASSILILGVLVAARTGRGIYALPILVPLALAGAAALEELPRRFCGWFNRLSLGLFCAAMLGAWLGWLGLLARTPRWLWERVHAAVPLFEPAFVPHLFLLGLAGTGLFVWRILAANGQDARQALVNWTAALGCVYLLVMTIGLPLCAAYSSYRPIFEPLGELLREQRFHSLATDNFGEPQRALLHYHGGIKTQLLDFHPEALDRCDYALTQRHDKERPLPEPAPATWQLIWERRHEPCETYRLYRKKTP